MLNYDPIHAVSFHHVTACFFPILRGVLSCSSFSCAHTYIDSALCAVIFPSDQRKSGQVLDKLEVERSRGITVKAQTASIFYRVQSAAKNDLSQSYLLNLIDCPGHVDFSYEVSRSLSACQGALLLVDCSQGIQAQTLANFYIAMENDLVIVPVLSKIDLPHSDPERVITEMVAAFDVKPEDILKYVAYVSRHGTLML